MVEGTLSSSEDDADLDGMKRELHVDTVLDENTNDDGDESTISPADGVTDDQWKEMMAEIDAASDTEDGSETDGYDSQSDASQESKQSTNKKRKRAPALEDVTDSEETDVSVKGKGSALQMRKRRALQRTSSLTKVATLKAPTNSSTLGATGQSMTQINTNNAEPNGFRLHAENADDGDENLEAQSNGEVNGRDETKNGEVEEDGEDHDSNDDGEDGFDAMFAAELDAQDSEDTGGDGEG